MHSRIAHTDLTIFNDEHIDRSKMCAVNLRICLSSDGQMHSRTTTSQNRTEQSGAEQNKTITQKETKQQTQQQTHSHDKFRAILLYTKTL